MLVVAVDTSGRQGSIALCRGDGESFEVLQLTSLEGGTYSAQLLPQIAEALAQHGLNKSEIDGFVVVSGPGSFTGLRVGLSTVKGLCEVLGKPLATVSMLEGQLLTYAQAGDVAVLDAGRDEIYVGEYGLNCGGIFQGREYMARLDEFAGQPQAVGGDLLTVDERIEGKLRAMNHNVRLVAPIHAGDIGRIGVLKLMGGQTADLATIDVNYIRRSDAELFPAKKPQC